MVINGKKNHLKKPGGTHGDLFLVGLVNIGLSCFGLPWLHLGLPHSDLYVQQVSKVFHLRDQFTNTVKLHVQEFSVKEQRVSTEWDSYSFDEAINF